MLYDHRTYRCKPGTIKKHLEIYEKLGKAPQTKHLGQPLMYATSETGDPNAYIHVWVYENAGDREAKRAAMMADPDWLAYLAASAEAGYLISQQNTLLVPAPFFPS